MLLQLVALRLAILTLCCNGLGDGGLIWHYESSWSVIFFAAQAGRLLRDSFASLFILILNRASENGELFCPNLGFGETSAHIK